MGRKAKIFTEKYKMACAVLKEHHDPYLALETVFEGKNDLSEIYNFLTRKLGMEDVDFYNEYGFTKIVSCKSDKEYIFLIGKI